MKGFSGFGYLIEQAASMSGKKAKKIAEDIKGGMLIEESTEKMNKDTKQRKIQSANSQDPRPRKENIIVGPPGDYSAEIKTQKKKKKKGLGKLGKLLKRKKNKN